MSVTVFQTDNFPGQNCQLPADVSVQLVQVCAPALLFIQHGLMGGQTGIGIRAGEKQIALLHCAELALDDQ